MWYDQRLPSSSYLCGFWNATTKPLVAPKRKYPAPLCLHAVPAFFKRTHDETNSQIARLLSLAFRRHPACWSPGSFPRTSSFLIARTPSLGFPMFFLSKLDLTVHFITLQLKPLGTSDPVSGTNQKPERRRPFGTGLVRHCPQRLF